MAVIDNPILNTPFLEPARHFKFDADGITDEILNWRRPSSHFVPIPRAKKKRKQLQFETEWTKDRIEANPVVDRIRQRVGAWRQGGYVGVTGTTSRLLAYWTRELRDKPLFFCQIEAAETAIYITEVARKYGDAWKTIYAQPKEAAKREDEARVWISGLEAVKHKIGVKAVYDLSATPFFLQGSGYPEGTLFPWVVSDFSLVDAIEAGIVKVPRVPVADNSMTGEQPAYRDLWLRIREGLPKKGRKTDAIGGEPKLSAELQGALHSLYDNYRQSFERWHRLPCAVPGAQHGRPS